jgi:arylsulfatase A
MKARSGWGGSMFSEPVSRRALLQAAGTALSASVIRSQSSRPPNIVLILADDLGYGDLQSYGSKIATPNLDAMAEEGVRFEQFYSASSVCSPSRAALLTGRYPTRVGVPDVLSPQDQGGLSLSEQTLPQLLKAAGYNTMCVGKWHLGSQPAYMPTRRGFDAYYGIPYSNDQLPSVLVQNTKVVEAPVQLDTLTQRYTQQAVDFIAQSKGQPFFLYLAHTFPHIPLAASSAFRGRSGLGLYGDVVEELDWSVGQVMQALKTNGLDQNTLVMFTSDNGPWFQGSPGRLRGRKGWAYEGGVREPFIARFPRRIPASRGRGPGGRVSHGVATTLDILPTVARLCGAPLPSAPLDGVDIWPMLTGMRESVGRDAFLYFDSWNLQCARMGAWKLHVSRYNGFAWSPDPAGGRLNLPLSSPELYNLEDDPDESYDAAADNPQVVAQIQARIQQLLPTFPAAVTNAWNTTMSRKGAFALDGGLPSAPPPQ